MVHCLEDASIECRLSKNGKELRLAGNDGSGEKGKLTRELSWAGQGEKGGVSESEIFA